MMNEPTYDWPGWPLKENPFGKEFDIHARERMIAGSKELLPFIKKYRTEIGKTILEVGPFFNPLITPEGFPEKGTHIFYWENDRHVLEWIAKKYPQASPIYCDLNSIAGDSFLVLKKRTQELLQKIAGKEKFDAVIVSHVFNYIEYKLFLIILKDFIKKDGIVMTNNVVDYGLPAYFSRTRPKSIPETIASVQEAGYHILEKKILPPKNPTAQKHDRLIIIAQNGN
ncbi:MAG: hypothetical protein WC916_00925 [Candidatus Woesearchaeota archaeon]